MDALRKHAVIEQDGQVTLGGLPFKKGDRVEVILLKEQLPGRKRGLKAAEFLSSPLIGMWADRKDITDSSAFARELREKGEHREDRE